MPKAKIKAKKKSKKMSKGVKTILTLSKYTFGQHGFNPTATGEVSFAESMVPFKTMAEMLFESGIALGTKIKVTMEPFKK